MTIEQRPPVRWLWRVGSIADLPNYSKDRRTLAYHEAGHAVLCLLAGVHIVGAQVDEEGTAGKVELAVRRSVEDVASIPDEMLAAAAVRLASMYVGGVMCELLLHGVDVEQGSYLLLNTTDWDNARKLLHIVFGTDTPLFYCQRLARAVLTENWAWVEAVAIEIDAHGFVDAHDIKRLGMNCPHFSREMGTTWGQGDGV